MSILDLYMERHGQMDLQAAYTQLFSSGENEVVDPSIAAVIYDYIAEGMPPQQYTCDTCGNTESLGPEPLDSNKECACGGLMSFDHQGDFMGENYGMGRTLSILRNAVGGDVKTHALTNLLYVNYASFYAYPSGLVEDALELYINQLPGGFFTVEDAANQTMINGAVYTSMEEAYRALEEYVDNMGHYELTSGVDRISPQE